LTQISIEALNKVVSCMLAENRSYFGSGGPEYYGVQISELSLSSHCCEFCLTCTFKSGVRYCCLEPGCHFGLVLVSKRDAWFARVRGGLIAEGVSDVPPMNIWRLTVIAEAGAIYDGGDHIPCELDRRFESQFEKIHEVLEKL